jgi:hypothetical protein
LDPECSSFFDCGEPAGGAPSVFGAGRR